MSYFPIISAPKCVGRTTIFNFPPNNWEFTSAESQLVNLTWSEGDIWRSVTVDEIPYGCIRSYESSDFSSYLPLCSLPLLSLSSHSYPDISKLLPPTQHTNIIPTWRASIELHSSTALTSYQGELDPFPVPSSLLTFSPLIQFHESISNYLILLNIEKSPVPRNSLLKLFKCKDDCPLGAFEIFNNSITTICLDDLSLHPEDLFVGVISDMSAIPLYFSYSTFGDCISLEHTHPPASYVIHGKRWQLQSQLKKLWFSKLLST